MSESRSIFQRPDALLIALAALLLFGCRAASMPLFDLDEGAFSEATREMLASGDWLMTWLNGQPRYDKPILIYWLQSLSVLGFGMREFAFRLPSILCATGWVLLVHQFTLERYGRTAALFAAMTLALSLMVGVIGHAATADALLNLCIAGALLDAFRWLEAPRRGLLLRVFAWLALGTLTKGPVAVAVPLAVTLLHSLWCGRLRLWLRAVFDPAGIALYLLIVLPWILALSLRDGGDFLRHFLFDHNIGRYSQTLQHHGGQVWYYLLWLPLILLPFTGLLPRVLLQAVRERDDSFNRYALICFGLVFLLFSFSSTQLPHYVLYGCTPLFVLMGRQHERLCSAFVALLPGLLFIGLLAALPAVLPLVKTSPRRAYEAGVIGLARQQFGAGYIALTLATLIAALVIARLRRPLWQRLAGVALMQAIAVWGAVAPVLAAAQQHPIKQAALLARELGLPAVSFRTDFPSFSVYREAITPNRPPQPGELVFVKLDRVDALRETLPTDAVLQPLFQQGGIALLGYQIPASSLPASPPRQ